MSDDAPPPLPPVSPRPVTNQVDGRVPGLPPGAPFPPPSNQPIEWTRWVPEVRLLEAPRIALSPVIVALALAGLIVAAGGDLLIREVFGGESAASFPWEPPVRRFDAPLPVGLAAHPATDSLFAPVQMPWAGVSDVLSLSGWAPTLRGAARVLWAIATWGFFGTAIARCAAVRFAIGASGSPTAAVRMAGGRWISSLGGPLLPAVGLGVLALGLIVFGWAGDLPGVGPWLVAILWGAALLAGLAGVILLILAAIGWPLMLAALAVEGSDAFDAFSRAFSYVLGRPLRLAIHLLLSVTIAVVAVSLAWFVAVWAATLAAGAAGVGMGSDDLANLGVTPNVFNARPLATEGGDGVPGAIGEFWLALWSALPTAYAAGLFWTLTTISYFLLRYADDAVETDELWQPAKGEPVDDDEIPRVGVAASDLPTIERPHGPSV